MLPPAQPRSWMLTSPPTIVQPTLSYDTADFKDLNTGVEHVPMVNTTFIEADAQFMGFQATDEDYQSSLHSISMVYDVHT